MLKVLFGNKITIGSHKYHGFRIPASVVINNEILLFVEANLIDPDGKDTEIRQIISIYSSDYGKTWSSPINIAENRLPDWNQKSIHDPCPVVIGSRCVLLFYTWNDTKYDFDHMMDNSENHCNQIYFCESYGFFDRWILHRPLLGQISLPEWSYITTTPCNGIVLTKSYPGRILVPCYYSKVTDNDYLDGYAYVLYSDDGENWKMSDIGPKYTNETTIIELEDGSVLHNLRHEMHWARWFRISHDGGETFEDLGLNQNSDDLRISRCQGSMIRMSNGRILFSCPADDTGSLLDRIKMSLYSVELEKKGVRLDLVSEIFRGSCGYSALIELDGSLFVIYEQDDYSKIVFQKLIDSTGELIKIDDGVKWCYGENQFSTSDSLYLEHIYQTQIPNSSSFSRHLIVLDETNFLIDPKRMMLYKVNSIGMIEREISRAILHKLTRIKLVN